jgi:hypothetical protein
MSSDNTVADRLLDDARKKTARQENPATGKVALIVGAIALLVSPVSILGWIVGTAAVVTGVMAVKHPATAKQGKIGIGLGVAAILIGLFFFTLNISMR